MALPGEPEILAARQGFSDAQLALAGAVAPVHGVTYACSWYGTAVSNDRGSLALVSPAGALSGHVGDTLLLTFGTASVYVYVFGSYAFQEDIRVTRRAYAALSLLAVDRIDVSVGVVA